MPHLATLRSSTHPLRITLGLYVYACFLHWALNLDPNPFPPESLSPSGSALLKPPPPPLSAPGLALIQRSCPSHVWHIQDVEVRDAVGRQVIQGLNLGIKILLCRVSKGLFYEDIEIGPQTGIMYLELKRQETKSLLSGLYSSALRRYDALCSGILSK